MVETEDKGLQQTIDFAPKQIDLHKGRQGGRNIRPGNPFSPKQSDKRIATTSEVRIELGENKGDKYGDRQDTRRIRGPKASRENNSKEERNEESTGND